MFVGVLGGKKKRNPFLNKFKHTLLLLKIWTFFSGIISAQDTGAFIKNPFSVKRDLPW